MTYDKTIPLYDDGIGSVSYVQHMGSDLTVVNSARVSFGVEKTELDDRDRKLINYLIKHKHTSTLSTILLLSSLLCLYLFAHNTIVIGRGLIMKLAEDIRIRTYSSIYQSLLEHNMKKVQQTSIKCRRIDRPANLFLLYSLMKASELLQTRTYKTVFDTFNNLLDAGVCREQARMILPQNLYTEYYGTVNLNNLLKFIDLRTHEGAQWEIQSCSKSLFGNRI